MSRNKKNRDKNDNNNIEKLVLITAILNLVDKLIDIISKLTE